MDNAIIKDRVLEEQQQQERNEAMKEAKRAELEEKLKQDRFAGAAHFKSYYGQKEQGVLGLGSSGEEDSGGGWPT